LLSASPIAEDLCQGQKPWKVQDVNSEIKVSNLEHFLSNVEAIVQQGKRKRKTIKT
jgi:hypothetical protein